MFRRRAVVLFSVAAVLLAASVSVVVALYPTPISHPETADRATLIRWLATRDLGRESPDLLAALVRRLDQEFGQAAVDWQAARGRLNPAHKQRLWENIRVLVGPWFEQKVEGYAALSGEAQKAYLDRTLDAIDQWRSAQSICADDGDSSAQSPLAALLKQIDQWKDGVEPARRAQADRFLFALQARWLQRTLFGR